MRTVPALRKEGEARSRAASLLPFVMPLRSAAMLLALSTPCLLFGPACSSRPDGLPPIEFEAATVWESEHFEYYVQEGDDSVCAGVMDTLERHFAAIQEYLDFPWPEGRKIKYYKLREGDDIAEFGCPGAYGCYRGNGEIVSPDVFHKHELIHAYVGPIDYDDDMGRPSFLSEGIAEALGPGQILQSFTRAEWRDLFVDNPYDNPALPRQAAWFVGHLLNHYPLEQFMTWFLSTEYRDSAERMAAQFEKAYGRTVDEVWEEAKALSPSLIQPKLAFECSEPAISPDEGEIHLEGPGCDGERFRTLRVDGKTTVMLSSSQTARPSLLACEYDSWFPWGNTHLLTLAPEGTYLFYQDDDESLSFSFNAQLRNAFVEECEASEPVLLPDVREGFESTGITLSVPTGPRYVTLQSPPGAYSLRIDSLRNVLLEVCDTCDGECSGLNGSDVVEFDEDSRILLRLDGQPTEPPESTTSDHLRYARINLRRE